MPHAQVCCTRDAPTPQRIGMVILFWGSRGVRCSPGPQTQRVLGILCGSISIEASVQCSMETGQNVDGQL